MNRAMVYILIISCLLVGIAASAHMSQDRSEAQEPNMSPSPTPRVTGDIPSVRAATVPPPPLWANKIRNVHVKYVDSPSLSTFPVPAVIFRREAFAREGDWTEIREKIIYPAVNKSEKPIAAVVVEYFRDLPDIAVTVIWYRAGPRDETNYSTAVIERNASRHFPTDSYLRLFSREEE